MKHIIAVILIIIAIFLASCQSVPQNPEFWMEKEINACLPTAIVFKESLRKYNIWSEVFSYRWVDDETGKHSGHAMVAYLYPSGKNRLWTYDAQGSYRTHALTNNITDLAQKAHWARGNTEKIFGAEYIK